MGTVVRGVPQTAERRLPQGDTPRVILGCPLAGIDSDEVIDATPEIQEITEKYIGDEAFSNLPRKFKSSISGCGA